MQAGNQRFGFFCISVLFFAWGFITCMNDLLIPKFKADFALTQFQANLIQSAFFGAFFIISLLYYIYSSLKEDPINKIGYKNTLVAGLFICSIGCALFYPAGILHSYNLFLLSLLVLGSGVTLIQIAANPYVSILGEENLASMRLNLSQGLNSLGYVIAPVIGGLMLFGSGVYNHSQGVESVQKTYLLLALIFLILAIAVYFLKLPDFKTEKIESIKLNLKEEKNLLLGLVAIFFYVGSEVTVGSILINYLADLSVVGLSAHEADKYLSFYWGGLMIGRLIGAVVLSSHMGAKKSFLIMIVATIATTIILATTSFKTYMTIGELMPLSQVWPFMLIVLMSLMFFVWGGNNAARMIKIFAIMALLLTVISIFAQGQMALWSIIGIGLFNSIMWSNIFTISIAGLGKKTGKASSLLVMMIVGGAIMPALQGALADSFHLRGSLVLVVLGYAYLIFFAMKVSKEKIHAQF